MVRTRHKTGSAFFNIYEVYYTNDKPTSWSAVPMLPYGENPSELLEDLVLMTKAYQLPVLEIWPKERGTGERMVEVPIDKISGEWIEINPKLKKL